MVELAVNAEQARLLTETHNSAEIVDSQGRRLGFFARPFTDRDMEIAMTRASAGQPGRSTAEVLERLRASDRR